MKPHRLWLTAFVAALVLLLVSQPLLETMRANLKQRIQQHKTKSQELSQALQTLRADAAMAESLSHEIKTGDIESWLAPVDRLQIAAHFEPLAAASRLERFTYTLSPEQPYMSDQPTPDTEGLAVSTLSLEADAPHDGDVYRFIDQIRKLLPGHTQLKQLVIERLSPDKPQELTVTNVHFTASLTWLSNGTKKEERL